MGARIASVLTLAVAAREALGLAKIVAVQTFSYCSARPQGAKLSPNSVWHGFCDYNGATYESAEIQ